MTNSTEAAEKQQVALVIGPTMFDIAEQGEVTRTDQTAPVPILDVHHTNLLFGGGAHAFMSVLELQCPAVFITMLGTDKHSVKFRPTLEAAGMNPSFLMEIVDPNYDPQTNVRQYAGTRLMSRQCIGGKNLPNADNTIMHEFHRALQLFDVQVILLSDYDRGVCTPHVVTEVIAYANQVDIPVVVDPVPHRFGEYRGATIITPNKQELFEGVKTEHETTVELASAYVVDHMGIKNCITTCGEDGIVLAREGLKKIKVVDAMTADEIDTCGCGDAVAAAATMALFTGEGAECAARYALAAGACQAERICAYPVSMMDVHLKLACELDEIKNMNVRGAGTLCKSARENGQIVGVANGVFDMLHPGHVHLLEQAAEECDVLVVLMNTDESAERIKRKPTMSYDMRARMIQVLNGVDIIVPFDGDTPTPEIIMLRPNLLFKGPEFKDLEDDVPGVAEMAAWGGRFIAVEPALDMSTTKIIDRIRGVDAEISEAAPAGEAAKSPEGAGDVAE